PPGPCGHAPRATRSPAVPDLWIAGAWSTGSGERITVTNPATEEAIAEVPAATPDDVDRAVQAAASAFATWRAVDAAARARHLRALADACEADKAALIASLVEEQGKPTLEAAGELTHFLAG